MTASRIFLTTSFVLFTNLIIIFSFHFEFIPQVYFLGFRLNLFLLLNLILIFLYYKKLTIELLLPFKVFGKFKYWFAALSIPVLMSGIVISAAYIFGEVKIPKLKYFYEFGMTSLLDFPMYFVWTLPFIFSMIYVWFIVLDTPNYFSKVINSILISLSFSGFYLYNYDKVDIGNYVIYFLLTSSVVLYNYSFYKWSRSLWATSFSTFMTIFSFVLVFGSSNEFLIRTFFARYYDKWEGSFNFNLIKNIPPESGLIPLLIILSIIFFNFGRETVNKK